jgi:hypothetical protein
LARGLGRSIRCGLDRDPQAAMRKLLELANAMKPDHDAGRLPIGVLNSQIHRSWPSVAGLQRCDEGG